MKTRPILFSAPMVRAVLDGSKTQTRRTVKYHRLNDEDPAVIAPLGGIRWVARFGTRPLHDECVIRSPFGVPGDRLWVRETHAVVPFQGVLYRADEWAEGMVAKWRSDPHYPQIKWTPSIHMPRTLSRITLEVTEVRVERLQEISEEDALAEGVFELVPPANRAEGPTGAALALAASAAVAGMDRMSRRGFLASALAAALGFIAGDKPWEVASGSHFRRAPTAREVFQILWDSLNAKRAPWDSDPWVWVVSFKRVEA